jgi:hypothetical protein
MVRVQTFWMSDQWLVPVLPRLALTVGLGKAITSDNKPLHRSRDWATLAVRDVF